VGLVGLDDAGEGAVGLGRQGPDDRHAPAPDAVARRAQDSGRAAAGHRLRRLDHVARQSHHQVGAMHLGKRCAAAARPCRPAARAAPSLHNRSGPAPPHAAPGTAADAGGLRATCLGTGVDLEHRFGPLSRLGHYLRHLAQLLECKTGQQAVILGQVAAGNARSSAFSGPVLTLLAHKNKAKQKQFSDTAKIRLAELSIRQSR
jgi:hypothetical protein